MALLLENNIFKTKERSAKLCCCHGLLVLLLFKMYYVLLFIFFSLKDLERFDLTFSIVFWSFLAEAFWLCEGFIQEAVIR